jgi:hypothetical protein
METTNSCRLWVRIKNEHAFPRLGLGLNIFIYVGVTGGEIKPEQYNYGNAEAGVTGMNIMQPESPLVPCNF